MLLRVSFEGYPHASEQASIHSQFSIHSIRYAIKEKGFFWCVCSSAYLCNDKDSAHFPPEMPMPDFRFRFRFHTLMTREKRERERERDLHLEELSRLHNQIVSNHGGRT